MPAFWFSGVAELSLLMFIGASSSSSDEASPASARRSSSMSAMMSSWRGGVCLVGLEIGFWNRGTEVGAELRETVARILFEG